MTPDMARCIGASPELADGVCGIREDCARFCQTDRDSRRDTVPFWRGLAYITDCYENGVPVAYIPEGGLEPDTPDVPEGGREQP